MIVKSVKMLYHVKAAHTEPAELQLNIPIANAAIFFNKTYLKC